MNKISTLIVLFLLPFLLKAQNKNIGYFINEGLKNNAAIAENINLQQFFQIQNDIITAQNKKPQVSFTADYLFDHGDSIEEVHMELSNDNPFIVELNAGVKFGIIGIHASASYANLLSASVGIGLYF